MKGRPGQEGRGTESRCQQGCGDHNTQETCGVEQEGREFSADWETALARGWRPCSHPGGKLPLAFINTGKPGWLPASSAEPLSQ